MEAFRLLDLPTEIRLHVYRCFFDKKLIQVASPSIAPEQYRTGRCDTRNLLSASKQIYSEVKPMLIEHAIFLLDLYRSSEPFLIAKALGVRNVMIERGFLQLFPPEAPFRDMIPPYRQTNTFPDESISWDDIEQWRSNLQSCIVRFDLYLHIPKKGWMLLEHGIPFNYIPRIATAWDIGTGDNMTVEFYGRNASGVPIIEQYDPAVTITGDRKVRVNSRWHNSTEEDCLLRKILRLLGVHESERQKCGQWDENPLKRY